MIRVAAYGAAIAAMARHVRQRHGAARARRIASSTGAA